MIEEIHTNSKRNPYNSMTTATTRLWRPNNYRRGIDFKIQNNSTSVSCGDLSSKTPVEMKVTGSTNFQNNSRSVSTGNLKGFDFTQNPHSKIISIRYSDNITIQVYKSKMVGIWSQRIVKGHKETFLLKASSLSEMLKVVDRKKKEIISLIEDAMSLILQKLNLSSVGDFYKVRGEDWVRGDKYVDQLPRDAIIHEDSWKKVYDVGIEVTGRKNEDSTEKLKQHITNSILYDFAPLIAEELRDTKFLLLDIKKWCKENICSIQDVFRHEAIISMLPEDKRLEVTNWLFEHLSYTLVYDDIDVIEGKEHD